MCPGNNESAGKRKGAAARKGNVHLTTALVQAAVAARTKPAPISRRSIGASRPAAAQRAALAIAHKILIAAYHMLRNDCDYNDLGDAYLDTVSATVVKANLVKRLERLGYRVTLQPRAA